ncbi:MAG: 16S rRNA (cytosine(967)-C(5))-methyltransferase RsmB [Acidobacteria bacterium]|nr:MAG: 16S rRNA (cytosine(967)-C(5))-methyltransferase RsmB [Acidobacteriota bacterium]
MIAPARIAVYDVLCAVSAGRSDLATAVADARARLPDQRDRALATEIALGVQRWRGELDHLIARYGRRPVDRLDSEIVEILRLGVYQLRHLTRVPAAAVVHDGVNLARRAGKPSATGFVNAVLRAISRNRRALPLPRRPRDLSDREPTLEYLSITLSHPRWLVERWYDRLGPDRAERWLTFNNRPAPLTLRANRGRQTREGLLEDLKKNGISATAGQYAPDAIVVDDGEALHTFGSPGGQFLIQDEASQLVSLLAGPHPGPLVLDACASPGGKATALAASLESRGLVVACDVRRRRVELLRRTVVSTGADNIRIVQSNLQAGLPFTDRFSCVLVDAPCSGLGILRRDPDIRWRRQPSDLKMLAEAQRRMLRHAADCVTRGGRLVYATCSSEPEENEDVVDGFLTESPRFAAVDARHAHRALPAGLVDSRGHLRTTPDQHGLDAFFGAVFERTS